MVESVCIFRNFFLNSYFDFQLTKESRHALQAGEHINKPTLAQEYAILDKAATASETYLKNRAKHLDEIMSDIESQEAAKDEENRQLEAEIATLEKSIENAKDPNKDSVVFELQDNQPQRMQRIMRRNRLIQKIKDQEDVMLNLQEQLDNYMHRSFPSLG